MKISKKNPKIGQATYILELAGGHEVLQDEPLLHGDGEREDFVRADD